MGRASGRKRRLAPKNVNDNLFSVIDTVFIGKTIVHAS